MSRFATPALLAEIQAKAHNAYLSGLPDDPRSMAATAWIAAGQR